MREFREIRKGLGENAEAASPYIGIARTQLGILKARMAQGDLSQLSRTIQLEDGTSITVASRMGQDSVQITAASPNPPVAPEQEEFHEVRVGEPDEALPVHLPKDVELIMTPGDSEVYSATYSSNVFKGAVMDKAGKVTYLAFGAPSNLFQNAIAYNKTLVVQSRLVQLNAKLQEVAQSPFATPDWSGQFTYDYATDKFFINVFIAQDPRFFDYETPPVTSFAHRSLIQIGTDGSQTEMAAEVIDASPIALSNTLWGNSMWAGFNPLPDTILSTPAFCDQFQDFGWEFPPFITVITSKFWYGSTAQAVMFPISQPSTTGLIAAMFQGDSTNQILTLGQASARGRGPGSYDVSITSQSNDPDGSTFVFQDAVNPLGYAFLWDTVKQSIAWRGSALGTYQGAPQFDPWAHITPLGNAIFSVAGQITQVQMGKGALDIGSPPAGTRDLVVTNGDLAAYALAGGVLYHCSKGVWSNVTPKSEVGPPLSLLHDRVTNAVAMVMGDGTGVWILNAQTRNGQPLAPFKFKFKRAPTTVAANTYPQQFINGALLITYAPQGAPVTGMPATIQPGQTAPAWSEQMGTANGVQLLVPVPWIVGRYDIGQLQMSSSA